MEAKFVPLHCVEAQAANIAEFGEHCCCAISTATETHPEDGIVDHVIHDWSTLIN